MTHTDNPSTWEAGGWWVQGSLDYIVSYLSDMLRLESGPCFKQKKTTPSYWLTRDTDGLWKASHVHLPVTQAVSAPPQKSSAKQGGVRERVSCSTLPQKTLHAVTFASVKPTQPREGDRGMRLKTFWDPQFRLLSFGVGGGEWREGKAIVKKLLRG